MEPGDKFFPSINIKDLKQGIGLFWFTCGQRALSPALSVEGGKKWLVFGVGSLLVILML